MRIQISRKAFRLTRERVTDIFLFLYLSIAAWRDFLNPIMRELGLQQFTLTLILIVIYVLLFLFFVRNRRLAAPDFLILLVGIIAFFALTLLVHPEYEFWYTRSNYGVWTYVLRPDNGLYIYLFLRMVNDPKRIMKVIRVSAIPMYIHFANMLATALSQGYWTQQNNLGVSVQMAYNLSFGYDVLLFMLAFLHSALEEGRFINWLGAGIGLAMIILGGSRGPILDIGIYLIIYLLIKFQSSKAKIIFAGLAGALTALIMTFYNSALLALNGLLTRLNLSSRFVTALINGSISNDSGRKTIWETALNMIRENPFGYGAMGTRHVIGNIHIVGHPHQIFLEILVDFGVVVGTAIILFLLFSSVRILIRKDIGAWRGLFLIFFARACQLLVSLTYWHSIGLWGALAIGVCIRLYLKEKKLGNALEARAT